MGAGPRRSVIRYPETIRNCCATDHEQKILFDEQRAFMRPTDMFRRVELPAPISGRLLLHSMPGRFESLDNVWQHLERESVGRIVCLNEPHEIRLKSSRYADALESGSVPCPVLSFEIREGGVPQDRSAL